jgi:hypothetical protein
MLTPLNWLVKRHFDGKSLRVRDSTGDVRDLQSKVLLCAIQGDTWKACVCVRVGCDTRRDWYVLRKGWRWTTPKK